ncbi:MAG TPA: hypothetical protein VMV69_06765 [Pirellulales bacterium]|nr:hypothetical protein [Pirellulales bacterium]
MNEHCIAAYQQIGDFTVTKVDGKVQKNGGNVASYFLTPKGLVVNAVVGPVKADKLLSEAQWSEQLFQQMSPSEQMAPHPAGKALTLVQQAHTAQANDRVHQLLAENPLAPIHYVYEYVFEKLANQKVAQDRSGAMTAAAGLEKARKDGRPVLLVLFKGNADHPAYDAATEALLGRLSSSAAARPAKSCLVLPLPINELPALSNLANVSEYNLAERTTPTMVLVRPSGEQIAAIPASVDPRDLASQLWAAVNEVRFDKAQKLLEAGENKSAAMYLSLVKSSPTKGSVRDRAQQQWEQIRAGKPVKPTTAAAVAQGKSDTSASAAADR